MWEWGGGGYGGGSGAGDERGGGGGGSYAAEATRLDSFAPTACQDSGDSTGVVQIVFHLSATAEKVYWATSNGILYGSTTGIDGQYVGQGVKAQALAINVTNNALYWSDTGTNKIQRATLDGQNVTDLVTRVEAQDLALDTQNGKLYFIDNFITIARANLDGTNVEQICLIPGGTALAVDGAAGQLYFTNEIFGNLVFRVSLAAIPSYEDCLDVASVLVRFASAEVPQGLALDLTNSKLYYTLEQNGVGKLGRADLDGTDAKTLTVTSNSAGGVAVAPSVGEVAWANGTGVHVSNLDGDEGTVIYDLGTVVTDVAFLIP